MVLGFRSHGGDQPRDCRSAGPASFFPYFLGNCSPHSVLDFCTLRLGSFRVPDAPRPRTSLLPPFTLEHIMSYAPTSNHSTTEPQPIRDALGRFTKGNPGGPGNPFARKVAALRMALINFVTVD